jgi:hypothetical protein
MTPVTRLAGAEMASGLPVDVGVRLGVIAGDQLAALDGLNTGVRGGPEPESVTPEAFGRDIPEP